GPRRRAARWWKHRAPPARRRTACASLRRKREQPWWQDAFAPPEQTGPTRSLARARIGSGRQAAKTRTQHLPCLHDAAWHEQHGQGERSTVEDKTQIAESAQDFA